MTLLSKNKKETTLEDLREVPLPEPTESYMPVSHYDLVVNINRIANDLLTNFQLAKREFGLARKGQQMFGILTFRNGQTAQNGLGLSIGFRNSYDKSMAVGLCLGASVFVCSNKVFSGEITVLRKHTQSVWDYLEKMIITSIYKSESKYSRINQDVEELKQQPFCDQEAYKMIGLLYGRGVITPRQIPKTKREWEEPTHEEFEDRNLWSFYNAVTHALKTSPPKSILERHVNLHKILNKKED